MAFTTTTLAVFMETVLGASGVVLFGADPATSTALIDAVAEFEAVVDMPTASMTDDLKSRAIARWLAWRTAKGAAVGQYDVSLTGGKKFSRSQFFDHLTAMLADAEAAASAYSEVVAVLAGAGGTAYVSGMSTVGDPYAPLDEWA